MDHEAAAARAAKFGSPKYRVVSLAVHALIVVGVTMLLIRLSREGPTTVSRWLKIIGSTTMIGTATWMLMRSRSAGAAKRVIQLMAAEQFCFALIFSASFVRWESVSLAVTYAALALCIGTSYRIFRELREFNARAKAQSADTGSRSSGPRSA